MAKIEINADENKDAGAPPADGNGNGGSSEKSAAADAIACDDKGACSVEPGANDAADDMSAAQAESEATPVDSKSGEYLEMLRRMKAEFDNYKKRVAREKADTISYATEGFISKLLPVLDDLQRGIDFMSGANVSADMLKGVELVERQLCDLLADYNVAPYETVGKQFDPNIHDPLCTMESAEVEDNTIIKEERKGYMMHEKVLRPARVIVSRKPADAAPAQPGGD